MLKITKLTLGRMIELMFENMNSEFGRPNDFASLIKYQLRMTKEYSNGKAQAGLPTSRLHLSPRRTVKRETAHEIIRLRLK